MLAVGEHLWGRVDDRIQRMTSGLAGGLGCEHQDLCGAVSGGALLIGAVYGRTSPEEDDEECNRRVILYRERFIQAFGTTRCFDIREQGYGGDGQWPCSIVVERATRIVLGILSEPVP